MRSCLTAVFSESEFSVNYRAAVLQVDNHHRNRITVVCNLIPTFVCGDLAYRLTGSMSIA